MALPLKMCRKEVDPDQTAPLSGFALFAQTYVSENLGTIRYARYFHKEDIRRHCILLVFFIFVATQTASELKWISVDIYNPLCFIVSYEGIRNTHAP